MFDKIRVWFPLSRNSLLIIGLFIVLAAIPLTVFLTQQQQEIRQRADAPICQNTQKPSNCAICILQYQRPDILPFFRDRDWSIDVNVWDSILTNWCGIDSSACNGLKTGACSAQCQGNAPNPQTQTDCILRDNRTDILCAYQAWDRKNNARILPSNWSWVLSDWCSIDPSGCATVKSGICSMTTPTSTPQTCTLPADKQTPDKGANCASCITTNRPDLRPFFNSNGHSACTDIKIVNHWCNGGVSSQASQECASLVAGTCASQCGGTPTPTSPPGITTLQFSFKLQSITAPGNPKRTTRDVKVEIFNTANQPIQLPSGGVVQATLQADSILRGKVDLGASFTSGPYVVKIKVDNTLRRLIQNLTNITAGAQNVVATEVELVSGDVTGDNKLDSIDYANLVGCLDIKKGTSGYSCGGAFATLSDLNDNGSVDTQDLGILIVNFSNRTGD